ncbi:tetratricopeptide repeat protein [Flavobacterium piscinae]|uniref:tetratricopeptide repeat protein n=1 Tax=Flavobacterium piscinae TaxID=2506424 RepID=UPI002AAB012B|nr:hypothetical protein [Flavobacterium piscinae]
MKITFSYTSIILTFLILVSCKEITKGQTPIVSKDKVSNQNEKMSIVQMFRENVHLPMKERIEHFYKLKIEHPNTYDFENEDALNFYGYQLLWNNENQDAFLIFKLIVSEFPNSSNAYDSFGEICLKLGDKNQALTNYKKSLELNPENFNAEDQIAYILDPNKKPENNAEKFSKVYKTDEYRKDLEQLAEKITTIHPNVFKFITEENFWKLIEEKKNLITSKTTFAEFIWHCDEIIASVNCSHTSVSGFYQEIEMLPTALSFPLQTRWIDEKLFVINPMNNGSKIGLKAEITSINGVPVIDIVKNIYKHLPSQGYIETTKRHLFNVWSTCLIPYAMNFPSSYTITLKGNDSPIALNQATEKRHSIPTHPFRIVKRIYVWSFCIMIKQHF